MSPSAVGFVPLVPLWLLAFLAAVAVLVTLYGVVRRARGALLRGLVAALVLLGLAGPVLTREEREPLRDIALVVLDRSASMELGGRVASASRAAGELRRRLDALGDVETREVAMTERGESGTALRATLQNALAGIDPGRLAGVLVVSDGRVHDVAPGTTDLGAGAPLHLLLAGRRDETDRRLVIERAPSYAVVGERREITLRVDDLPGGRAAGGDVPVVVRQDGREIFRGSVRAGVPQPVPFELSRAGRSAIEAEAAPLSGEVTTRNNTAVAFVNGVRDRLRVLLISGEPYPGLRVWRNILKSDPSVDLVHFTILRPPEKQDGTPIQELALIAFPSRELFEIKLDEFDLIIFDRYSRRGLLPLAYLENVSRYVEAGGALLEAAGPEFAEPFSLFRTPLARVLPGRPSGRVFEEGFRPTLTGLGRRHPVTSALPPSGVDGAPLWGRWFRQIDAEPSGGGETLMNGVSDRPLLLLDRRGEGRVAQLLSDHVWLWARGFEGGGPQTPLLRRLVHWLMKEPELEEEALFAAPAGDALAVTRRSLEPRARAITITAPSGARQTATILPDATDDGLASVTVPAGEAGLYRAEDGEHTAFAAVRPVSERERADVLAGDAALRPAVEASGGGVAWLGEDGVPELRRSTLGRAAAGRGWVGLQRNERYLVTDTAQTDLLPPWLALGLVLTALGGAWWREGR